MNKNYMTFPMKEMRVTQSYYGEYSHKPHWYNLTNYKDYPIDIGGHDSGKEPVYCPCDEMVVTSIKGIGNSSVTNTIWLTSTSPVITPTFSDVAFMTLTHSDDSDLSRLKVGDKFKRGELICYEGMDGADSNHIHLVCGRGTSSTMVENSNKKWVMAGDSKKPEEVFYVDKSFTTISWGGSLPWVDLPSETKKIGTPIPRNTSKEQLEVIVDNLIARREASTSSERLGYINKGIFDYQDELISEGYVWYKIEDFWIPTTSSWIILYKNTSPRLIFTADQTGKYVIHLEKGKKLYID